MLLLRRRVRARGDDPAAACQLEGRLHPPLQQPVDRTCTASGQRLRGRRSPPAPRATRPPGVGHVPARAHVPAAPVHGVLQPVAELGRDAVRRGPRRVRLPQEHLRDGRGARRHHDHRGDHCSLLFAKTFGWNFYGVQQRVLLGTGRPRRRVPVPGRCWPRRSSAARCSSSSWWRSCRCGSSAGRGRVFLSSTRVIFAAAFDRMLPEWAAKVDDRNGVPVWRAAADAGAVDPDQRRCTRTTRRSTTTRSTRRS